MDCYIGLDLGTSAIKGVLLSKEGKILATASGEYQYQITPGRKLLDPCSFIDTCFDVINQLADSVVSNDRIAAICPCCASGNLICLDHNFQPLTPIIGWQSTVDEEELAEFYNDEEAAEVYRTVGWPVVNGFPIAYLPWIHKHKAEIIQNAGMICTSAEYLNFILTGNFGISPSMATPFYLMDQEKGEYNKVLLDRFEIKEVQLPPIYDKGTLIGTVQSALGDRLSLPVGTPVILGSFDHPSCATGAGVYESGEVLLSCGTSWVEFFPIPNRNKGINSGLLVDRFMLDGSPYCVMSSLTSVSEKIDARRQHYLGEISHREFDELILQSTAGCNGLSFDFTERDFTSGEGYEKCHIARAIMEGIANLLKQSFIVADKKGLPAEHITMVGGITNAPVCVQVIADTLERDIKVVNSVSAGAVGAAMLAGIGVKAFTNEKEAFRQMNFPERVYHAK